MRDLGVRVFGIQGLGISLRGLGIQRFRVEGLGI